MPKVPIDYSNTIMYKIVCKDLNVKELYVGHTVNFRMRKNKHASDCVYEMSKNYNLKIYKYIRENGGWSNWEMIEIEKYNCNDGNEARARERYWFEELQAKLNMTYPQRTSSEYSKAYKQQNLEKIRLLKNQKHDCECGGSYTSKNRAVHMRSLKHETYLTSPSRNNHSDPSC